MERVNVLVGGYMRPELLRRIAEADSRVHVLNVREAASAERERVPPFRFPEEFERFLPDTDVIFTSRLPAELDKKAPRLRWAQLLSAGVDVVFRGGYQDSRIIFTTASGVHPIPIAEWVVGAMLAMAKRFPEAIQAQKERRYWFYGPRELAGSTVGIIGMGRIGQRIGRLAHALDMRVIGVRRTVTSPTESADGADLVLPPEGLHRLLAESDYVVSALPGTPATERMLGREQFALMKAGSYFINVGRGSTVDEEALLGALQSGRLAGAALDVFATEPLPEDSPLWDAPNLFLTAHVSGATDMYNVRAVDLFVENLRRYVRGEPLMNVYDKERGY